MHQHRYRFRSARSISDFIMNLASLSFVRAFAFASPFLGFAPQRPLGLACPKCFGELVSARSVRCLFLRFRICFAPCSVMASFGAGLLASSSFLSVLIAVARFFVSRRVLGFPPPLRYWVSAPLALSGRRSPCVLGFPLPFGGGTERPAPCSRSHSSRGGGGTEHPAPRSRPHLFLALGGGTGHSAPRSLSLSSRGGGGTERPTPCPRTHLAPALWGLCSSSSPFTVSLVPLSVLALWLRLTAPPFFNVVAVPLLSPLLLLTLVPFCFASFLAAFGLPAFSPWRCQLFPQMGLAFPS